MIFKRVVAIIIFVMLSSLVLNGYLIQPAAAQSEDSELPEDVEEIIKDASRNPLKALVDLATDKIPGPDLLGGSVGCLLEGFTSIGGAVPCVAKEIGQAGLEAAGEAAVDKITTEAYEELGEEVDQSASAMKNIFVKFLKIGLGRKSLINSADTDGTSSVGPEAQDEGWILISYDIQRSLYILSGLMVGLGILWHAIKMIWNKSGVPLADLIKSIAVFIFVATAGIGLVQMGAAASDELATVFLNDATNPTKLEGIKLDLPADEDSLSMLILNIIWIAILFLGMVFQVFMVILKDVTVVVASGILVLAGSGQFYNFSKAWLDKILGVLIGCLAYKPLVALLMNIAITVMSDGTLTGTLIGAAMIFASAFGFSPLMKMFTQLNYSGGIGSGSSMGTGAIKTKSPNVQPQGPSGAA